METHWEQGMNDLKRISKEFHVSRLSVWICVQKTLRLLLNTDDMEGEGISHTHTHTRYKAGAVQSEPATLFRFSCSTCLTSSFSVSSVKERLLRLDAHLHSEQTNNSRRSRKRNAWLIRNLKANSLVIFLESEILIILRLHM